MFVSAFINFMFSTFVKGIRDNTRQELNWLAIAPVELQEQLRSQLELQKEQELVQMLARTFDAIAGWQKEEEALRFDTRWSSRSGVRYARTFR